MSSASPRRYEIETDEIEKGVLCGYVQCGMMRVWTALCRPIQPSEEKVMSSQIGAAGGLSGTKPKPQAETKNVVGIKEFKSEGDWINRILGGHCTTMEGAKPESKDKDGKVIPAVKGKSVVDSTKLAALAKENKVPLKDEYPNTGLLRMNVGNMLRARAKKRGGLFINGKWTDAPSDFECLNPTTENRDGTPIPKAKSAKADSKGDQAKAGSKSSGKGNAGHPAGVAA